MRRIYFPCSTKHRQELPSNTEASCLSASLPAFGLFQPVPPVRETVFPANSPVFCPSRSNPIPTRQFLLLDQGAIARLRCRNWLAPWFRDQTTGLCILRQGSERRAFIFLFNDWGEDDALLLSLSDMKIVYLILLAGMIVAVNLYMIWRPKVTDAGGRVSTVTGSVVHVKVGNKDVAVPRECLAVVLISLIGSAFTVCACWELVRSCRSFMEWLAAGNDRGGGDYADGRWLNAGETPIANGH